MRVGLDLMGSDNAPSELLKAALELKKTYNFELHVFGKFIEGFDNVIWHPSESFVSMDDVGVLAASSKKTSMYHGIQSLESGAIDAFISCGNTAALLTYSNLHLSKLPQIKRLGLLAQLGTQKGKCFIIDVGANTTPSLLQLMQFSTMGQAAFRALRDHEPKVGILNIAKEKGKGPQQNVALYQFLENHENFIGFVEPSHIFEGHVDLVITDGFTGNILLKTAEAVASMVIEEHKTHSIYEPSSYPGAFLCGADRLVMKVHGEGNTRALQKTIEETLRLLSRNYLTRVKQEISALKEDSF